MHAHEEARADRRPGIRTKRSRIAAAVLLSCATAILVGRSGDAGRRAAGSATSSRGGRAAVAATHPGGPARAVAPGPLPRGGAAQQVPFDLGAVIEQVHYAYRPERGAWRGGHTTYAASVGPDGSLEVVPYHHPHGRAGSPEGAGDDPARGAERGRRGPGAAVEGSAVAFGPPGVSRGAAAVASGAGEPRVDGTGRLEIARGAVTERLANRADGIEQSWRFAERPDGRGDLEVQVALAAGAFAGETESGLHFTGGSLGIRYGHATWIDALGVETAVPARWTGGAIVLRVPAAVADGSVYPAVLDPVISPELSMDEPVYGPASSEQSFVAIASDGTGWLVVWQDYRGGLNSDIYGARVSGAGAVLDPTGIPISTASVAEYYPAVAWGGTCYLVAWRDGTLRGARVSAAGQVLDPTGFAISAASYGQTDPAIAWNGTHFLVAWYDGRNGTNDIFAARVTPDAEVLDPAGIAVSTAAAAQVTPAVAWNGADWLVVWHDYRYSSTRNSDIYGARVAADGTVRDPSGIGISTEAGYQFDPAVACDGAAAAPTCLVAWYDNRTNSSSDVYGARLDADGTVLEPHGFAISTAANYQRHPGVAWDGTEFFVVWGDARLSAISHVYGARVTAGGTVLDPSGILVSSSTPSQAEPVVAWNGSSYLVAWEEGYSDVHGARVSGAGEVLDAGGFRISTSANSQSAPAVAWDGTSYLVVWRDVRSGSYGDIYGVRLSGTDGSPLDPTGIAISTAANDQKSPAVAWDGTDWLVVWDDERNGSSNGDVFGARVTSGGTVLDPAGIAISSAANDQTAPAVASDGTDSLVVWEENRGAPTYGDIVGARVSAAGAVLDTPAIVISAGPLAQRNAAVDWDGASYLVVWDESRTQTTSFDILGARVSGAGAVRDGTAIVISAAAQDQVAPAVAWDGTNHVVVWQDFRSGSGYDVYGARVTTGGTVLDPAGIAISTEAGDQALPAVASDGNTSLVAWQDLRSGGLYDVYAARVTPDGSPLDAGGFLVSGSASDERGAAVVSPGAGKFLVAYYAFDLAPEFRSFRVRARTVEFGGTPIAFAQSIETPEDTAVGVTLGAQDPQGDPLTFAVVTSPAHGALSGTGAALTYTPHADYFGPDAFTFRATDGTDESNVATVLVTVTPVNDAPVAQAQDLAVDEDGALPVTLAGSDVDGDSLTYTIATAPAHGTLSGAGSARTYAPDPDFHGADAFTFVASDGTLSSSEATVSIAVASVNDAPVARAQAVTVAENGSVAIALEATDVEGDALTYAVATPPAHGSLTGTGATLTYAPAAGYHGPDAFGFKANDGTVDSAEAAVSITVTPAENPPKGGCGCGTAGDAAPFALLLAIVGLLRRRTV